MVLTLEEMGLIIGVTSAITTGSTTGIMYLLKDSVKTDLCNQMNNNFTALQNRLEDLFIRVGILEKTQ